MYTSESGQTHTEIVADTDAFKVLDQTPLKVSTATSLHSSINKTLTNNTEIQF